MQVETSERVQFQSANHDIPDGETIICCFPTNSAPNCVWNRSQVVVMSIRNRIVLLVAFGLLHIALDASNHSLWRAGRHIGRVSLRPEGFEASEATRFVIRITQPGLLTVFLRVGNRLPFC